MPNNSQQVIKDVVPDNILAELPGDFLFENPFQPATHNTLTNNKFKFID